MSFSSIRTVPVMTINSCSIKPVYKNSILFPSETIPMANVFVFIAHWSSAKYWVFNMTMIWFHNRSRYIGNHRRHILKSGPRQLWYSIGYNKWMVWANLSIFAQYFWNLKSKDNSKKRPMVFLWNEINFTTTVCVFVIQYLRKIRILSNP